MNVMVGYFSRKKAFHIVEWFETHGEAIDWFLEHRNTRKDFVIFIKAEQLCHKEWCIGGDKGPCNCGAVISSTQLEEQPQGQ